MKPMEPTVLVIDDSSVSVALFTALLELGGFVVHSADSAEAARPLLESLRPDVIVLDVDLPGLDGISFTRELKGDPRTSGFPIMVVTAGGCDREADARAAGADGFATKPISARNFENEVRLLVRSESRPR